MDTEDKYAWQKKTFGLWSEVGFRGIVYAVTSAGKTVCGANCIRRYLKFFPLNRVWVIANTREVIQQWQKVCKDIPDLEYFTYLGAVSRFEKLKREGKERFYPQLMILDECHIVMAKASGRVLDYGVKHILGMSGTPNGSDRKIGKIFQKVDYDEANIADTTVHLVKFQPTKKEMDKYAKSTSSINHHREKWPNSTYYNDPTLQMLYLRRRQVVYKFDSRLEHAMKLIKKNSGRKIMCFCMLQEQAQVLSNALNAEGIDNSLHLANHEGLSRFINGDVNVCISCKKLQVGFNLPEVDVGIIVSTATSPLTLCQTIGRIIRPLEGKHADVYILLAKETSDDAIEDKHIFIKDNIVTEDISKYE